MNKILIWGLVSVLFIIVMADTTGATILRNGSEWLEFSYTAGLSRDHVEVNLLGTAGFEGYRYASREETAALLDSYFIGDLKDYDVGLTLSTAGTAADFLADFGALRKYDIGFITTPNLFDGTPVSADNFAYSHFLYGVNGDSLGSLNNDLLGYVNEWSLGTTSVAGSFSNTWGSDATDPNPFRYGNMHIYDYASLLVRDLPQPTPEPTTILLLGIGLLSLAGVSRKRQK